MSNIYGVEVNKSEISYLILSHCVYILLTGIFFIFDTRKNILINEASTEFGYANCFATDTLVYLIVCFYLQQPVLRASTNSLSPKLELTKS